MSQRIQKTPLPIRFKHPRTLMFIFVSSIITGILFTEGPVLQNPQRFLIATLWSIVIWVTQWYGNESIVLKLDYKIPWLDYPIKRLIIGFFAVVLYSGIAIIVVNLIFTSISSEGFPTDMYAWTIINGRIAVINSLVISTVLTSVGFFKSWRIATLNEEKLKNELLEYQYKSLLNQVNPHFLFNSLNVLTSLVHEDADLSVRFIQQLSKVYRYTLEHRESDLVSLEEEKKFIESYLFLLHIRFENALFTELDLKPDSKSRLIPMALQILIENAIKHNKVTTSLPLTISIKSNGAYVEVRNNLQLPENKLHGMGFGLENIQKRLRFLTDKELLVDQTETEFIAKLPLISDS